MRGMLLGCATAGLVLAAFASTSFHVEASGRAQSAASSPSAAQAASSEAAAAQAAANLKLYTERVVPIFQANCYRCHGGMNYRGGFQMDTKAGMAKGGHDGPVLVPGHPEQSLLVKLIRHEGPANDPMPMPAKRDKISGADIATVEQWVKAGALMPEDAPKP